MTLALVVALSAVAACSASAPAPSPGLSATGVIISADGPTAAQVDTFTMRTVDGRQLVFSVGTLDVANGGLPAPHIREHLVSGDPITVEYRVQGSQNIALRYVDAE